MDITRLIRATLFAGLLGFVWHLVLVNPLVTKRQGTLEKNYVVGYDNTLMMM